MAPQTKRFKNIKLNPALVINSRFQINHLYYLCRWLSTRPYIVTVGPQKERFILFEGALAQTSFFHVNTNLRTDQQKQALLAETVTTRAAANRRSTAPATHAEPMEIEDEDVFGADDIGVGNALVLANVPDLHIPAKFHLPRAFRVFNLALLGHAPEVPKDGPTEHILLEAYLVATLYKWEPLQDAIMDRLRTRHRQSTIAFSEVLWMMKQLKDNAEDKMIKYLVTQVATEYSKKGRRKYEDANPSYRKFMESGAVGVRMLLTDAIGQKAEQSAGKPRVAAASGVPGQSVDDEDEELDGEGGA